jgi:MFS family permease
MFYGWRVVAGAFASQMFVVGFFTYSVSLLIAPVRAEFGANLAQVMYSLTAGTFIGLLVMPVAGVMVDRLPVRWLCAGGMLTFGLGLWALSKSATITQYIVIFGLTMSLANALAGSLTGSAAICRWFTATRGRALGVAAIGTSAGGVVLPAMVSAWVTEHGWRDAMEYLALCIIVLVLPFVIYTVRGRPADVGMEPEPAAPTSHVAAERDRNLSLKEILNHPAYWYIGLSLGLLFSVYTAILANITPYATELGNSETLASALIMTVAIAGFVGKLVFGVAADKINLKAGLWTAQALVVASFLVLAAEPGYVLMVVAAIGMGLAAGGMLPVWGAMLASVFGLLSYGRVMGLMGPLITLCVMPGFALVGKLYDLSGSYALCLLVYAGVTVVAAALLLPLRIRGSA